MRLVPSRFDRSEGGCVGSWTRLRGAARHVSSPEFVVLPMGGEKPALAGLKQGIGGSCPCDAHRGALG